MNCRFDSHNKYEEFLNLSVWRSVRTFPPYRANAIPGNVTIESDIGSRSTDERMVEIHVRYAFIYTLNFNIRVVQLCGSTRPLETSS